MTFFWPTVGGVLIGVSASVLLLGTSRVVGISGLAGGLVTGQNTEGWRVSFLIGLMGTGLVLGWTAPWAFDHGLQRSPAALLVAGVLVGIGTRMSGGCTSGHGVCGLSRRSPRSLTAVLTFMAVGVLTATVVRVVFGGVL